MTKTAVAVIAVIAVLSGCGSSTGTAAESRPTVIFDVTGSTQDSASFTIRTPSGGTKQGTFDLPLTNTTGTHGLRSAGYSSGDFLYLSAQLNGSGDITCKITVDGAVIDESTSTGDYVITTCQGTMP